MTMKSIVAFAMLLALGVTAVGMYMDTKPRQVGVRHFTIEQVHCAVYSDC